MATCPICNGTARNPAIPPPPDPSPGRVLVEGDWAHAYDGLEQAFHDAQYADQVACPNPKCVDGKVDE